jgi:diguanylate cyclase (GGDEF)-like protein/PAS domain S-box-containing protein
LAIDVFNEAARIEGIRLVWKPLRDIPLDNALDSRIVDIWPLVGSTPERRKKFHMSDPWLEADFTIVSLKERPIQKPAEAAGLVVAHARLRRTGTVVRELMPKSRILIRPYRADAVQAVCTGDATAAVLESQSLDAVLLDRPQGCEQAHFNISSLPESTTGLSILAVPEAAGDADALRKGIHTLVGNGFMTAKLDQWAPFSAVGARSVWAQQDANLRSRIYSYVAMVVALLAVGLGWFAYRSWQLKIEAERAGTELREAQRRFTAFMDNTPMVAFMKDSAGRLLYVNRAWSHLLGKQADEVRGRNDFEIWPEATARELRAADEQILRDGQPVQLVEKIPVGPGDLRDMLVVKFPFSNEKGETCVGGTTIDITERETALRQVAASEAKHRQLFHRNPLPAWVVDDNTQAFLMVNQAASARYGWTEAEFVGGMELRELMAPGTEGVCESGDCHHRTKDGLTLSVHVTSFELDYGGRQAKLMIVRDVTEQERMLEQLRVSEERWQLALRGAGDALWDWDLATNIVFRSPRWKGMLGYAEQEIGDRREDFLNLLHPDDRGTVETVIAAHLAKLTPTFTLEYRLRHKDGTWRWIMDRGQAIWDERGKAVRMAGSQSDVTERRHAEDLLALQARTDGLTGLMNRREFDRMCDDAMQAARVRGEPLSICVCDLDRFKQVNDTYGHIVGDRVLVRFGEILRQHLRKTDLVARLGGDEFIVALPNTSAEEAYSMVERMRRQLHDTLFDSGRSDEGGRLFRVTGSFGISEMGPQHREARDLVADADHRLYDAKDAGRNRTLAAA